MAADKGRQDIEAITAEIRAARREVRAARFLATTGRELPPDEPPFCSFCGAGRNNVRQMLAGNPVNGAAAHICDECVEVFYNSEKERKQ